MRLPTIIAALTFAFSSVAAAQEITPPEPEIVFVEKEVVQEIPEDYEEYPEPEIDADARQLDCLARIMHHEARGEGRRGQMAVGYVVVNRANDRRFPSTYCSVATQPYQFSNFHLGRRISNYDYYYSLAQEIVSDYRKANDPSRGALYFHATSVRPRWSHRKTRTTTIRRHVFYY